MNIDKIKAIIGPYKVSGFFKRTGFGSLGNLDKKEDEEKGSNMVPKNASYKILSQDSLLCSSFWVRSFKTFIFSEF